MTEIIAVYAPNGSKIGNVVERIWYCGRFSIDQYGDIQSDWGDMPETQIYDPCGETIVSDELGNDWCLSHCRKITLREYPDSEACCTPWPTEIQHKANRYRMLCEASDSYQEAVDRLPEKWMSDHQSKVLELFFIDRLRTEKLELGETIAAWRASPEGVALETVVLIEESEDVDA